MDDDLQDLGQWVTRPDDLDEEHFVSSYVAELELGSYRVVDLFRDMRPYLENDQDLLGIARALSLLPRLFSGLVNRDIPLLKSDQDLVLSWLCHRIVNESDDRTLHAGLDEVISTIKTISAFDSFSAENAVEVVVAIFTLAAKMAYKDLKAATRANLLGLVQSLFIRYETRFSTRPGVDRFVVGLTDMAQFEKSPKCLGILFPLYTQVTKAWASDLEAKNLTEKLFTSFYRFFPIDVQRNFSQERDVPTMEELSEALEECITCHQIYADLALEQLLENLDTNQTVKKKTLAMTLSCIKTYDVTIINKWSQKIWAALKHEVWQGENDEVVQASLAILTQVCKTLSTEGGDWEHRATSLRLYINHIGVECHAKTQDSMQWLIPNGRIFFALATSSVEALWIITKSSIPKMHLKWQDLALMKEKAYLLISLNEILKAHVEFHTLHPTTSTDPQKKLLISVLTELHGSVHGMYDEALETGIDRWAGEKSNVDIPQIYLNTSMQEDILVKSAVEGLALLMDIPEFYQESTKTAVVKSIVEVHSKTVHEETRLQCVFVLKKITYSNPTIFSNTILPSFFRNLPDQIVYTQDTIEECDKKIDTTISTLERLVDITCSGVCQRELTAVGDREQASSYWHRNFDALAHKLILKLNEVVALGSQMEYANALVMTLSQSLVRFEKCLDTARGSPATIEPKPYDPELGPYTYIVMALLEILRPEQERHERGPHTREIQWFTRIRDFPTHPQNVDRFVQSVGEITLTALRSKLTTDENNFLLKWNRNAVDNDSSALSSLFTEGSPGCDMLMLDMWQADVRRGPHEKCIANVLAMYMIAGTRVKDRNELRIDLREACIFMMKGYIGYDIEARHDLQETNFSRSRLADQGMLWYFQLLLNKFGVANDGPQLETPFNILEKYVEEARRVVDPIQPEKHSRILRILAHFSAAILAAFDVKTANLCLNMMVQCLEDVPPFGLMTARLFRILLEPSPIIKRENFCNVRSVVHGWVLDNLVPRLRLKWTQWTLEGNNVPFKNNYLVAIAGLLHNFDPTDYITDYRDDHFEDRARGALLPLILEGTTIINDAPSKLVYLKALTAYIKYDHAAVEDHMPTVIRGLTLRTRNTLDDPSEVNIQCRVASIEALKQLLKHVDKVRLAPFQLQVANEIHLARGDPAADVRHSAVEVNTLWTMLWPAAAA
ncbi:hypothetical protein EG329_002960 [Mollisiaceae sp. DMI_Dod_QoI]|nr:hypothetical protein EG329_002960 [Helotiales sp. DMI_Dod_QoI]